MDFVTLPATHTRNFALTQYEGNMPHPLDILALDHGSLVCERCGACVSDHTGVEAHVINGWDVEADLAEKVANPGNGSIHCL